MTSKREIKWCMIAEWLNWNSYCSHSVAYVSPQTVLKALQEQILLLSPSLEHKSSTVTPGDTWSWGFWLRLLGILHFYFLKKWFFFYLHFVCMRGRVWRHRRKRRFLTNTSLKMSFNLQIQYGTSEGGWALLSTCPAPPCSTWKAKSKKNSAKPWLNGKEAIYTERGSWTPQNHDQLEILTS